MDKQKISLFNGNRQADPRIIVTVFFMALLGTLAYGNYFAIARLSWILLAFLFILNDSAILYAGFFFAAFFHGAGFAPELFFTIKHFHIALGLGCIAQLLQKGTHWDLRILRRILTYFIPFILIIILGLLNYLRISPTLTSIKIPLNILLTMICCGVLTFFLLDKTKGEKGHQTVRNCIFFFCGGAAIQIVLGFINHFAGTQYLQIVIPHNNHMGILSVLSFFFALFCFKTGSKSRPAAILSFTLMMTLFAGVLFSCSRTSWISFAIGNLFFFGCGKKCIENFQWRDFFRMPKLRNIITSMIIGLIAGLSLFNRTIYSRFSNIDQLISPSYWHYILEDKQNFGCFGIYRLRDLQNVSEGLKTNPLIGIGFTRSVVDIHGFNFLVLSATGIIGLAILAAFGIFIFVQLWRKLLSREVTKEERYLALAASSTIVAWFFISFMESYFLQFVVWINFCIIIYVLENSNIRLLASSEQEREQK